MEEQEKQYSLFYLKQNWGKNIEDGLARVQQFQGRMKEWKQGSTLYIVWYNGTSHEAIPMSVNELMGKTIWSLI